MNKTARTAGLSLIEVLISAAILANLALATIALTDTVARTATDNQIAHALTRDARYALNALKDDLRAASRAGSVEHPDAETSPLRTDPDRPGSITLHLDPEPTPQNAITYYIENGTLYRAHRTTLTPLARGATDLRATVEGDLVTITLTTRARETERTHQVTARFRND